MAIEVLDAMWPLAGEDRALAIQSQPPYTTPYSLNTRNLDALERRNRGGSRPGLARLFPSGSDTGAKVNMLNSVLTGTENVTGSLFEEPFDGASLAAAWSLWSSGTPAAPAPIIPPLDGNGNAYLPNTSLANVAAIHDAIAYESTLPIEIEVQLNNSSANLSGIHWVVALGLVDASDYNGGVVVDVSRSSGSFFVTVRNQGATLLDDSFPVPPDEAILRVVHDNGELRIYVVSANNLWRTVSGVTLSGTRFGFQLYSTGGNILSPGFRYLNFGYWDSGAAPIAEPALVAASGGSLRYESVSGSISQVTGQNVDVASDRLLSSDERFGKLYIADYEVIAEGEDGALSGTGTTFDSATYADWTALGETSTNIINGFRLELMSGGSGTYTPGVYDISAVASGSLTIEDAGDAGASAIPFRLCRALKVFDYRLAGAGKLVKLAKKSGTAVQIPLGCTIVAVWNDRLCLSGDPENPGDTFMSRQGDVTDWVEDSSAKSPIFGEFDPNSRINEPVRAVVPYSADYLVLGGVHGIHVLRGNPARGGVVDTISNVVGIIGKFAWCITPNGFLVVLTGDGFYVIDPSVTAAVPFSRNRLPSEFLNLDTVNNDIQLGYDHRRYGICVAVTPTSETEGLFYFIDWEKKSFHKENYPVSQHPTAMTSYVRSNESAGTLVFGGREGILRRHDDTSASDDGVAFESEVWLGPFQLGGSGYFDGVLVSVIAQLASLGGGVRMSFKVGNSIEAAYRATPRGEVPVRAGRNRVAYPRLRGNACFIVLKGTPGAIWAFEAMWITRERMARQRLLA